MTIAQKIAELAEALGVDIPNDGQIADNLNAITLAKGGTITSNTNISEAIKNLANTIGQNDGGNDGGGSNNNTGVNIPEGLYFYIDDFEDPNDDASRILVTVFDRINYPELFDPEHYMVLDKIAIYFGDPIDNSNITFDPEMYTPKYVDSGENIGEGFNSADVEGKRLFNRVYISSANSPSFDYDSIEEGTPVHCICIFRDHIGGNNALDPIIAQLHSTWRVL